MGKIKGSFAGSYDRFVTRPTLLPPGLLNLIQSIGASDIVEFASGTGTVSIGLALEGYPVVGVDYSPGMLKTALKKARDHKIKLKFNMSDISVVDLGHKFDLLLCLGNTVPHFTSAGALRKMLVNARRHLRDGGHIIIQQLNYNRILKEKPATFEINIDRDIARFKQYRYRKILIDFVVTIVDGAHIPPRIKISKVILRPWLRRELSDTMRLAGFKHVKAYGNYSREQFTAKSKDLIIVAKAL
jgi:2-polyprenyl-3-methyl-5-hydroxy-6-metoxy-1,4-benzoquinol methylase